MDSTKYIGMDVHQASISVAIRNAAGKLAVESIIETKARTILEFIQGLQGSLWVTFEEGTSAAWLYDLLKPHVAKVIVCDPRKNALLKTGNKNDRVDARKLSDLLRAGLLTAVYHGESGVRTLRELSRSYLTVTKDLTRVMNRLQALYRSWAIPCAGEKVYSPRHRSAWLEKLWEAGVRRRAEQLYQQLDILLQIRRDARRELLRESRKHPAQELLRQIPQLGPIRVALLIALVQTPHRFRTKRQLWAYCGLAAPFTETFPDTGFIPALSIVVECSRSLSEQSLLQVPGFPLWPPEHFSHCRFAVAPFRAFVTAARKGYVLSNKMYGLKSALTIRWPEFF